MNLPVDDLSGEQHISTRLRGTMAECKTILLDSTM
jgi:hypothetical protein